MDFPTLTDSARVIDRTTRLDGSLEFTPPITGTVSFVLGAGSTANHLLVRRAVDGVVAAEARILDLQPPMIDSAGPAYGAGQSRLWLTFDEPIKVLRSASAPAETESLGRETPLDGFTVTVLRNMSRETIAVTRAYYSTPAVVLELANAIEAGDSVGVSYRYEGGAGIYDTAVERGVAGPAGRNQMNDANGCIFVVRPAF